MLKKTQEKVKYVKLIQQSPCSSFGLVTRYSGLQISEVHCDIQCYIYTHDISFFHLQEKALEQLKTTEGKTVAAGQKMDLVFYTLQLGFFYMDFDLISKSIDKAKK